MNVIENSLRYADGSRSRSVAHLIGDRVAIGITDRGPGVAHAEVERIFEPSTRRRRRCRRLRARAGDRARLRRGERRHAAAAFAPGQGATFTFQFPAAEAPAAVDAMNARTRVLICDDEAQILRALRVILGDAGFEVIPAMTAQEALDAAAVRRPEAAIIDLVLPDGDGVDVCRSIREWSEMPILVLSAVGDEREKVRALEAGADDYVTKPFGPDELVARLRAALRRVAPTADRGAGARPSARLEIDLAARRVTSERARRST